MILYLISVTCDYNNTQFLLIMSLLFLKCYFLIPSLTVIRFADILNCCFFSNQVFGLFIHLICSSVSQVIYSLYSFNFTCTHHFSNWITPIWRKSAHRVHTKNKSVIPIGIPLGNLILKISISLVIWELHDLVETFS